MNVSPVNKLPLAGALMATLWVSLVSLVPLGAMAQSGPVDLSPSTAETTTPTPPPTSDRVLTTPGLIESNDPVIGGMVEAQELDEINPDVAGTLSAASGGFGADMWAGTERHVLENLLAKLPVTSPSRSMRDLMHRLLLTGAKIPDGGVSGSLISLRASQLLAMGDFAGVSELLSVVPGYTDNPELLRVEVDTRLLTGDVARACEVVQAFIEGQNTDYWQKVFIFCQVLEGHNEQAQLGMALLEELGVVDPVFYDLVDAISSQTKVASIDSLADPTPLHLALARVAKVVLPSDVISSNRPGVLRTIAISPNASSQLRLEAAERAELAGALNVDALRQLYGSIEFTDDEVNNALNASATRSGPLSRALLYRATLSQTVPAAQAEALTQALSIAREGGRYASAVRAFLPQLSRLEATPDLAWFAPEAIRAFLITSRHEEAGTWFTVLSEAAQTDTNLAKALAALMPVAKLSGFDGAQDWSLETLPAWWTSVQGDDDARDKATVLTAVFKGLAEDVPAEMWGLLTKGASYQPVLAPHPALWFLLEQASIAGRVGETVLLSMIVLGEGGPARADPMVLNGVLQALNRIGLAEESRAMALEAVMAAGL